MVDSLTPAVVQRLAALASLELDADEQQAFTRQLQEILSYVDALRRVDTTGVVPTAQVGAGGSRERADEVGGSLTRDEALAGAPDGDRKAGLFKVPRVLG